MSFPCPLCGSSKPVRCLESRPIAKGGVRRRHECTECNARWSTREMIRPESLRSLFEERSMDVKVVSCLNCTYFSPRGCSFGFPEAAEDYATAQECLMYKRSTMRAATPATA